MKIPVFQHPASAGNGVEVQVLFRARISPYVCDDAGEGTAGADGVVGYAAWRTAAEVCHVEVAAVGADRDPVRECSRGEGGCADAEEGFTPGSRRRISFLTSAASRCACVRAFTSSVYREPRKTSCFCTFPSCQVGEAVIYS